MWTSPWNGYANPAAATAQYPAYPASEGVVPPPGETYFSQATPTSHTAVSACACHACATGYSASRWYLGISGGWADREIVHEAGDPLTFIIFDDGFAANAAIGYRFEPFRMEAEYSFMNQEVDTAGAAGLSSAAAGNVNLRALMFNLYHDVQFDILCWHPYVGAGIGLYQSEINSLYPAFFDVAGPPMAGTAVNTTSDMPFAYQFRIGATRPLSEKTEFYMGYRYFRGEELEFAALPFSNFAPTFHPDGAKVHSVELGLRVNF
jgi:opacity protein-like surface antigen